MMDRDELLLPLRELSGYQILALRNSPRPPRHGLPAFLQRLQAFLLSRVGRVVQPMRKTHPCRHEQFDG